MRVPNAENAVVPIAKLIAYCLDPSNEVGKHKAKVFASALGLRRLDHAELSSALLNAVKEKIAVRGVSDKYGERYQVDFLFDFRDKSALVRSVWIIDTGSEIPRLITCYVLE